MKEVYGMKTYLNVPDWLRWSFLLLMIVLAYRFVLLYPFFLDANNFVNKATLYKMAQHVVSENAFIQTGSYALPNKH